MKPKAKFRKGDYVTNLFDVGFIVGEEHKRRTGAFSLSGWWYEVDTDEDQTIWMYEPDMVKIEPDNEMIEEWVRDIQNCGI